MTKESSMRKCSHCGQNGHNSRTCNNGRVCSFKLFGVRIDPTPLQSHGKEKEDDHCRFVNGIGDSIRKCKSMGNLQVCTGSNSEPNSVDHGYLSDGLLDRSNHIRDKKKGVPWTEDEHRSFLIGLKKLGKGDWRGISRNYVPSRTPTQVASHAQKYFIRMRAMPEKRKRRSSLFDMPFKESISSTKSSVLPSKEASNVSPQPTAPASPVTTSIRLPVSPMARTHGIQDFNCMSYMMGYRSSYEHRSSSPKCLPVMSFVPVVSYTNQGHVYPLNSQATEGYTACDPSVYWPLQILHGSSQAGFAASVTKKDGMGVSIGALSL